MTTCFTRSHIARCSKPLLGDMFTRWRYQSFGLLIDGCQRNGFVSKLGNEFQLPTKGCNVGCRRRSHASARLRAHHCPSGLLLGTAPGRAVRRRATPRIDHGRRWLQPGSTPTGVEGCDRTCGARCRRRQSHGTVAPLPGQVSATCGATEAQVHPGSPLLISSARSL